MDNACKVNGHIFQKEGRFIDQDAQERGFCSHQCETVHDKSKALDERFLNQEGN